MIWAQTMMTLNLFLSILHLRDSWESMYNLSFNIVSAGGRHGAVVKSSLKIAVN